MTSVTSKSSSKLTSACLGKASFRFILLTFLSLTLYVLLCLVSSTAKLSVIVDMSIKMKSNVVGALNSFVNLSSMDTLNGSFTFGSTDEPRRSLKQVAHNIRLHEGSDALVSVTNLKSHSGVKQSDFSAGRKLAGGLKPPSSINNKIHRFGLTSNKDASKVNGLTVHRTNFRDSENAYVYVNEESSLDHSVDNSDADYVKDYNSSNNNDLLLETNLPEIGLAVDIFGNPVNSRDRRRKSACDWCFNHSFNYVIQNENACRVVTQGQEIDLLILVTTTHRNVRARMALRATWLSHARNNTANIRYVFLLGQVADPISRDQVLKENDIFQDIIKEDFLDSYRNLTYKTIMGFKWAATKCAHAKYVLKTDDDMYVNIPNLMKIFSGPLKERLKYTIIGACAQKARPIRNMKSKWFASIDSYPDKYYPGFCSGTGYVTSMNVVRNIYEISPSVPFFHLEDVYVSLCVNKLRFRLQNVPGFHAGRQKLDPCIYKGDKLITTHQLTPMMLRFVWHKECQTLPRF